MTKKHKYSFFGILLLSVIFGGIFLYRFPKWLERTEVIFLNVGQGDAILISQGRTQVLIDAGKSGKEVLSRLGRHIPFWDRQIEFVIATHPDADHIGGFPGLLRSYTVERVLSSGGTSDTEIAKMFEKAISEYSREAPLAIFRGANIEFPHGGKLEFEYPFAVLHESKGGDTNASSVVARFTYGETSFLLTGDLPKEETVLPLEKKATVLKVAHHGSKYSTGQEFLDLVHPKEAVISVGKNMYGHPDPGVLERLKQMGVITRRTDLEGDVRYICFAEQCNFAE